MKKIFLKSMIAVAVVGVAVAISSVATFAATYTFNANDLTTGNITTETTVGTDNFFTLTATDEKFLTVDGSKKTGPTTNTKYTQRIKTNGPSTSDARLISFTLTKTAEVTVEGLTGKKDTTRYLGYTKDADFSSDDATVLLTSTTNDILSTTVTLEPGTYHLGVWDNSFCIYGIVVTEKENSATIASTVKKTNNDYYAVDTTNNATYIIHAVTADEMKYASLALEGKDGSAVAPTTEVYTSVVFSDDSELKASEIGASAIYAVKVTGTNGDAPTATFNWIESK